MCLSRLHPHHGPLHRRQPMNACLSLLSTSPGPVGACDVTPGPCRCIQQPSCRRYAAAAVVADASPHFRALSTLLSRRSAALAALRDIVGAEIMPKTGEGGATGSGGTGNAAGASGGGNFGQGGSDGLSLSSGFPL